MTPKQRMLNAYRGIRSDRLPVAPEFWYYYPAKVLGVDMMEFAKIPFHRALKTTFEKFGCEGWGCTGCGAPVDGLAWQSEEKWLDADTVVRRSTVSTPKGILTSGSRQERHEPGWATERHIKDFDRDMPAFEYLTLGGDIARLDPTGAVNAWKEVGESYLLEMGLGTPFFDYVAEGREGGFETAVVDFIERERELDALRERYTDHKVRLVRALCEKTPFESFFIGCSWSCNSLIGPTMWRRWDKPYIKAVADEVHRHGRLLHAHIHGKCMETVEDFAEIGIDCVCPFERPPGGDVEGLPGLKEVARALAGRVTMNGNIHTVETLIRSTPADVRREVGEVLEAFAGNPRVIVGTGDQVGRETPEENLHAMIDCVKQGRTEQAACGI
ncbi:MAG: uroporphyrinogen decarboxylase family protein [bacterium]